MKVFPDDTMRGLELRKGTIDLVVNDLPPDIVYQLEKSEHVLDRPSRQGSTSCISASTCATRCSRQARAAGDRLCDQPRRHHQYLRRGLAPTGRPG